MNKEAILEKLNTLPFPKDKYIVIGGASMVIQNIKKDTDDIDIVIVKELESSLQELDCEKYLDNEKVYKYNNMKLFPKYYDDIDFIEINNIRYATLESILSIKKQLHRKKDQKDIKMLDLALCLKDNYRYEKELIKKGITLIAGIDEVGRGPLVGPVVAACVILPLNYQLPGLTDSKKLSEKKREEFYKIIMEDAISVGIGIIDENIIDEINIYEATKLAMKQAIANLNVQPEHLLIDAMPLEVDIPSTSIIKGDIKSISISAASVIAKVTRDRMIDSLGEQYPYYNFKKNKGYPTKEHLAAINQYGIIKQHRKTYGPIRDYLSKHDK